VLVVSALLLVYVLAGARRGTAPVEAFTFSREAHPVQHTPAVLNRFGLWVGMMIALTVVNYGYPIAQLALLEHAWVPVIPIGSR